MHKIKIKRHLDLAEKTGAFFPQELEVLHEVLVGVFEDASSGYIILDERLDDVLRGYIIFGRTPLTDFGWDIYWLVVDKEVQRTGVGRNLLQRMQEHAARAYTRAIIRIETAGKKEYAYVRNFYTKTGFDEVGRITNFYTDHDDLVIFSKTILAE